MNVWKGKKPAFFYAVTMLLWTIPGPVAFWCLKISDLPGLDMA